ncbi:hypothetical protein HC761_02265 [bacterium]|nr:hypothetical protein [bacterium]
MTWWRSPSHRDRITADRFCGLPVVPFEDLERSHPPAAHEMFVAVGYDTRFDAPDAVGTGAGRPATVNIYDSDGTLLTNITRSRQLQWWRASRDGGF